MTPDNAPDDGTPPPRKRHRVLGLVLITVLAGATCLGVLGIFSRQKSEASLANWTQAQAIPTVDVVALRRGTKDQELVLPGDVQAFYEAPIYARVNGYLKMWYKDIGAHVKAGQQLAVIEAPELDQQLEQAKNDLASVRANGKLADLTAKRWTSLLAKQAVSQQSADEKTGDAVAKNAMIAASQSNVDRLQALENFKFITAPFDGVVTARETDIGALINAGSGSGVELFKVADIHQVRVYVRVPQAYASQLRPGLTAELKLAQYPQQVFTAKLVTTSNEIAKDSRTVLVELLANNSAGKLWPGTFAEVHFQLPPDADVYHVPTSALVFREHGLEVATVDAGGKVLLKPITTGRDLGTEIEVRSGLDPSDRVIDSPPDSLSNGDPVKVANATASHTTRVASKKPDAGTSE